MKKVIIPALFVALLVPVLCMTGCSNSKSESAEEQTPVVDSVAIAKAQAEADSIKAAEEKERLAKLISPDRKWLRIKGPVKKVVETKYGIKTTYNFDQNGKLGAMKGTTLNRNANGQITTSSVLTIGDYNYKLGQKERWKTTTTYTYNEDGYVINTKEKTIGGFDSSFTMKTTYTLTEEGWIMTEKSSTGLNNKYSYSDIDDHGNWRKATVNQGGSKYNITRTITYWE